MQLGTSLCCHGNWFEEAPSPGTHVTAANCIAPDMCEKNCCLSSYGGCGLHFLHRWNIFHGSPNSQHSKWLRVCFCDYQDVKLVPSANRHLHTRPTFSKSLTVSVAVLNLGNCSGLVSVDPCTKINGSCYCDELLLKRLLPAIRSIAEIRLCSSRTAHLRIVLVACYCYFSYSSK